MRQHRALAERYGRMHSDLVSVRRSLLDVDAQTIGRTTSEAARVIAEENGDWLAMWFLDVEHPPWRPLFGCLLARWMSAAEDWGDLLDDGFAKC